VNSEIYKNIKKLLEEHSVMFQEMHHGPTRTSADSANARGEDIGIGGKALVLKVGDSFKLFVLSASRKISSSKIKDYFHVKRTRFATPEELLKITGLVPGSVPPFGNPITGLELYVDPSIIKNERIAFNAGSLTDSIVMKVKDYEKLVSPVVFDFSSE
jgi:prolyl-tRNA editing enzyme YbaK/EbsC (Cys-tRNA(Pro) deacylase)